MSVHPAKRPTHSLDCPMALCGKMGNREISSRSPWGKGINISSHVAMTVYVFCCCCFGSVPRHLSRQFDILRTCALNRPLGSRVKLAYFNRSVGVVYWTV